MNSMLFCLVLVSISSGHTQFITNDSLDVRLYNETNFKGFPVEITFNGCLSLKQYVGYDKKVESVNTYGNCINLYKAYDCTGEYIILHNAIPTHNDLTYWKGNFSKISSISPCYQSCHPSMIQRLSEEKDTVKVQIFADFDFKGLTWEVRLKEKECRQFPKGMQNSVSSLKVEEPFCIELHGTWNCKPSGKRVQIRPEIPFQNYLIYWDWVNDGTKAVSLCGFNCLANITKVEERKPDNMSIAIYSEIDFGGIKRALVVTRECVNIPDELEDQIRSLQTYKICVELYELSDCNPGGSILHIVDSESNLEERDSLKSIKLCDVRSDGNSFSASVVAVLATGVFLVVSFVALSFVTHFRRKYQRAKAKLTYNEIQKFFTGNVKIASADPSNEQQSLEYNVQNSPYDSKYEIDRSWLMTDPKSLLGTGEFAFVFKGHLRKPEFSQATPVAVKCPKPNANGESIRNLLKEVKVMIYVGSHENILELLGCCTDQLNDSKISVVTPLCENGSLEKYLRNCKGKFRNLVMDGKLSSYANLQLPKIEEVEYLALSDKSCSTINLLKWAYQVANAMEFLEHKKVIHGDLATRNILLNHSLVAKVSDFGLSKQLYQYTQYMKQKKKTLLPWRWLAIESLKKFQFSSKSDVWAYGITIWEIFTLGDIPYSEISFGKEFVMAIANGQRLEQPEFAPEDW